MPYREHTHRASVNESEYWKIWGRRIKITDTCLVFFTCLLAGATIALWWATRDLVTGESETAKRQLRAYVGVAVGRIEKFGSSAPVEGSVIVKNFGQTPAYNLNQSTAILPEHFPYTGSLADLFKDNAGPPKRIALLNPTQDFLAGAMSARPYTEPEISGINEGKQIQIISSRKNYLSRCVQRNPLHEFLF
jgi:hypothetical protein